MTTARIARLRQALKTKDVDAIIISQPENRFYLSGFDGSDGFLLITQREAIIATDFRYVEQAKQQSPQLTLFEIKGRLEYWFIQLLEGKDIRRLGFEAGHATFGFYRQLIDILDKNRPGIRLMPLENTVERLRGVKEPDEIEKIRKAAEISDRAIDTVTAKLKPGLTEIELAWLLERYMRENGSGVMPFEVIVAAGPNGALAHHKPSDRPIAAGEPVVIDMGARCENYCSDLTRTICLGKADAAFRKIYGIVQQAQEAAIAGIRAGMTGVQADAFARDIIIKAGYGEKSGHGLGHGVGLNVHDTIPRLSPLAPHDPLADGMVFSIEPGIYLPDWGGVRIEDLAILENGKVKLLSHARKWHEK